MNRPAIPSRAFWLALTLVLPAVSASWSTSAAWAQESSIPFRQDSHAFRFVLNDLKLKPLQSPETLADDPAHTVFIVFGQTDVLRHLPVSLEAWIERGGAALIATDRQLAPLVFDVQVSGRLAKIDSDSRLAFRGSEDCPLVQPLEGKQAPIFAGFSRVATNRPSFLISSFQKVPLLATLPGQCRVEGLPFMRIATPLPFAAGGPWGKGRFLILADHSVFINDMMLQPDRDNDNFDFAYECLKWLTDSGRRTNVLFLDEGTIVADFHVPLQAIPDIPLPTVQVVDKLLAGLEDDDLFNRFIREQIPWNRLMGGLVIFLTMGLLTLGLIQLARARHTWEVGAPPAASHLDGVIPTLPIIDQRYQTVLQNRNLWEAARALARQTLEQLLAGGAAVTADEGPMMPSFTVVGNWGTRRRFARLLQGLWDIAYGSRSRRVSPRQFARLLRNVQELKSAFLEGRLRFDEPEKPA